MNIHGIYLALLEGRFLFDFLHEEDLHHGQAEEVQDGDPAEHCTAQRCGVRGAEGVCADGGGSIMASFETALYDEKNVRRKDFGIADIFGIHVAGARRTRVGNAFMGRIERKHPILDGFDNTDWLPGAQWLQPTAPVENPVMTVIPPFVNYPPELAYPPVEKTDMPDLVAKEIGTEPTGLLCRRHRADDVAIGQHGLEHAAAECDPLGIKERDASQDKW